MASQVAKTRSLGHTTSGTLAMLSPYPASQDKPVLEGVDDTACLTPRVKDRLAMHAADDIARLDAHTTDAYYAADHTCSMYVCTRRRQPQHK